MIERCDRVLAYTSNFPCERLDDHGIAYDATVRNIELLGGSSEPYPRRASPAGASHRMAWHHRGQEYFGARPLGIDDDILWDVILKRVPELKGQLEALCNLVSWTCY